MAALAALSTCSAARGRWCRAVLRMPALPDAQMQGDTHTNTHEDSVRTARCAYARALDVRFCRSAHEIDRASEQERVLDARGYRAQQQARPGTERHASSMLDRASGSIHSPSQPRGPSSNRPHRVGANTPTLIPPFWSPSFTSLLPFFIFRRLSSHPSTERVQGRRRARRDTSLALQVQAELSPFLEPQHIASRPPLFRRGLNPKP